MDENWVEIGIKQTVCRMVGVLSNTVRYSLNKPIFWWNKKSTMNILCRCSANKGHTKLIWLTGSVGVLRKYHSRA